MSLNDRLAQFAAAKPSTGPPATHHVAASPPSAQPAYTPFRSGSAKRKPSTVRAAAAAKRSSPAAADPDDDDARELQRQREKEAASAAECKSLLDEAGCTRQPDCQCRFHIS